MLLFDAVILLMAWMIPLQTASTITEFAGCEATFRRYPVGLSSLSTAYEYEVWQQERLSPVVFVGGKLPCVAEETSKTQRTSRLEYPGLNSGFCSAAHWSLVVRLNDGSIFPGPNGDSSPSLIVACRSDFSSVLQSC